MRQLSHLTFLRANFLKAIRSQLILACSLGCLIGLTGCGGDDEPLPSGAGDFTTSAGNANISGTLFLPEGEGPFPVIIIVPGSSNDPKEDSYEFNSAFLPEGFAVYHYDKRGIGQSTGSYSAESLENPFDFLHDRTDDILSIVELLVKHSDIRNDKIGLMGASQGAWVNCLVYDQSSEIDFMLMVVGGVIATGPESYYDALTADPAVSVLEATNRISEYTGPTGFDPISIIEGIDIPVSWIYGGMDRSHPSYYDIPILESLNKSNFSIYLFENSNHDMEDVTTGEFDPNLFPTILAWLDQNGK